jgi:YHS domain-containing protein
MYFVLGYALYLLVRGMFRTGASPTARRTGEVETFRDPVCGVYVTREDAVVGNLDGVQIHFCSMECLEKYRSNLKNTSTK